MNRAIKVRALLGAALISSLPAGAQSAVPPPAGAANGAESAATGNPPQDPQGPDYTVPGGTKVLLSLKSALNTKTARPGDNVYLVSSFPVVVGTRVLLPAGMYVQGVVDRVDRPGRVKGRAKLLMHFTTMIFPNGQVVSIPGIVNRLPGSAGPNVKDEGEIEQAGGKGHDAGQIARGAEIGAEGGAIGGAVAGNTLGGLAYGGLAGAAGGAIYTLLTRGNEIAIPEGTGVEMVLQRPLTLQPAQLAGINGAPGNSQYIPAANQQAPMRKPGQVLCPPGELGCS